MIDSEELIWYEAEGVTYFERSPTGPMLDRLDMAAHKSAYCHTCAGKGIVDVPWSCVDRKGETLNLTQGAWCKKCNGTGSVPVRLTAEEQRSADDGELAENHNEGARAAVDDSILIRYAQVSRILDLMDPFYREAIEVAYGPMGEFLETTPHGRAWALTPMTSAGKRLIAQERTVKDSELDPDRPLVFLTKLVKESKGKKWHDVVETLRDATREAIDILKIAEFRWESAVASCRKPRKHAH
jgi:hypothetical protein